MDDGCEAHSGREFVKGSWEVLLMHVLDITGTLHADLRSPIFTKSPSKIDRHLLYWIRHAALPLDHLTEPLNQTTQHSNAIIQPVPHNRWFFATAMPSNGISALGYCVIRAQLRISCSLTCLPLPL